MPAAPAPAHQHAEPQQDKKQSNIASNHRRRRSSKLTKGRPRRCQGRVAVDPDSHSIPKLLFINFLSEVQSDSIEPLANGTTVNSANACTITSKIFQLTRSATQHHDPRRRADLQAQEARVVSAKLGGLEELEQTPRPGYSNHLNDMSADLGHLWFRV